jgi:hypothetical protein
MTKKNFFTGSVFQFYVPEIKKYAFCKFFDFKHLSEFHGLLAQVFDHFTTTENNSLEDLKDSDWLFGPRSMHKWPNLRKDTGWKSLGILSAPDDEIVPDFKGTLSRVVEDDSKVERWYAIHNLNGGEDCEYRQIHHLERKILTTSSLGVVWRTGMEYCRINGLPVKEYYDLNELGIKSMYLQMINVPIYKEIPKEIRGKALPNTSRKS